MRQCFDSLERKGEELIIIPQVLIEFWAVATRPANANGLGMTTEAAKLELDTLQELFKVLPDNEKIFEQWRSLVVKHKISGKPTHDARIAAALIAHKIENIVTLNPGDFKRFTQINAVNPQDI
ncbi:MAG: PIN domain-containing protein [Pyrinomonadaceae bacterium]|nr:PIN domain-containing protein [Pyrinomonadaceae bacterium]